MDHRKEQHDEQDEKERQMGPCHRDIDLIKLKEKRKEKR